MGFFPIDLNYKFTVFIIYLDYIYKNFKFLISN